MHGSRAIKTTPYGARNYNCRSTIAHTHRYICTGTHIPVIGPLRANFTYGVFIRHGVGMQTPKVCNILYIFYRGRLKLKFCFEGTGQATAKFTQIKVIIPHRAIMRFRMSRPVPGIFVSQSLAE